MLSLLIENHKNSIFSLFHPNLFTVPTYEMLELRFDYYTKLKLPSNFF